MKTAAAALLPPGGASEAVIHLDAGVQAEASRRPISWILVGSARGPEAPDLVAAVGPSWAT